LSKVPIKTELKIIQNFAKIQKQKIRHYFVDFIVFGYAPEDVEKFVKIGTDDSYIPDLSEIRQSRQMIGKIEKLRKPGVQYKVCN